MKLPKHSAAAVAAHPAPERGDYATGEMYADACRATYEARVAFDAKPATPAEKLDAVGIDVICERLVAGESQRAVAASIGVSNATLIAWLAADANRSARARESRAMSASHWDEMAVEELRAADPSVPGAVAIAREIASHYRWRASKYAPKDYGDKLDITAAVTVSQLTDEQLMSKAQALAQKVGINDKL